MAVAVICATVCLVICYRHKRSQSVDLQYPFEWCDIWNNSIRFSELWMLMKTIIFFSQTNEWLIGFLLQMMVGINRIFKVNRIFVKVDFISYNGEVVVLLYLPVTLMCAIQINGPSFLSLIVSTPCTQAFLDNVKFTQNFKRSGEHKF